jgi:hypothetical protein
MSAKIDCLVYLKEKLSNEFTKLITGENPDLQAAQNIQRLVTTAENISDGFFAQIEPCLPSQWIHTVQTLNKSIISGESSAANFDEYVVLLVKALQA